MMFNPSKPIGECSAQELAAAILLNAGVSRFNPQQVLADLTAHRHLWRTFLMGLPISPCPEHELLRGVLLPLRDLEGHWNLDTLYVLARSDECVAPLIALGAEWGGATGQVYNPEQAGRLMSRFHDPQPVVWFWWD